MRRLTADASAEGARADRSAPEWLYADQQGSVVATADSSGASTTYAYGPNGEPRSGWSGGAPAFRYTGQIALASVSLYYYKARMYDPALGRFLQTDPVGYGAGTNLYEYAANDPVNATDPAGRAPCYSNTGSLTVTGPDGRVISTHTFPITFTGECGPGSHADVQVGDPTNFDARPEAKPAPPSKRAIGTNLNPPKSRLACFGSALWENKTGLALDAAGWVANLAIPEGSAVASVAAGSAIGGAGIISAFADNNGRADAATQVMFAYTGKQAAISEAILRGAGAGVAHRIGFVALIGSTAYDITKVAASYNSCPVGH